MSSALGYGNVTGHFFVWRVYEAAIFDLSACLGRSPPAKNNFILSSSEDGPSQWPTELMNSAIVEEDVGCARLQDL